MLAALSASGMLYQQQSSDVVPDAPPTLPAQPLHKPGEMLPLSDPQPQPPQTEVDPVEFSASFYIMMGVVFLISVLILALKVRNVFCYSLDRFYPTCFPHCPNY
jgi:hypothetical protein